MNNFPAAVDRMQQGVLNMLLLGRLMINPQGLATSDAFKVGGNSVLDTSNLYYDGNSQGGIIGGSLIAVAPVAWLILHTLVPGTLSEFRGLVRRMWKRSRPTGEMGDQRRMSPGLSATVRSG